MMDQLKRALALICVTGLGLITVPATASAAPPVSVTAEASAEQAPAGDSVTVTADEVGARSTDTIAIGIKTDSGWSEVDSEPVGDDAEHSFEVTPPVLGRNVYRVGIVRGTKVLAASAPVVITGVISVAPNPVVAGQPVTLRGTAPTPIARPVGLQALVDGTWRTVDADFSGDDGSVEFTWTPTQTTDIRFIAPARTVEGVAYPRLISAPVTVTVTEPEPEPDPEPTVTRVGEGLGYNSRLSGDGRHLLYTSDPAVASPAVYSSGYFREEDPIRTRLVPDIGDPASSGYLGVSADGRYVLIDAQPKPAGADSGVWGLYVWDTATNEVDKVIGFPAGTFGPLNAYLSADGSKIAFSSAQDDLLPGDANKLADAYVIDRDGDHLQRISNDADGDALATGATVSGISADGSVVLFGTRDALDGDTHPGLDLYRYDVSDDSVQLVSEPADSADASEFSDASLSEDGRFVGYSVNTGMLVGSSYVWDAQKKTRDEVPLPPDDQVAKRFMRVTDLSADGGYALLTYQNGIGDSVLYRWDRSSDELLQVSGSEFGEGRATGATSGRISDDGSVIAFTSVPRSGTFRDSAVFVWSLPS